MHEIKTEITINTDIKKVWEILSDFANYPSWNSFFKHISGELATDEILSITVAPPGSKPMSFSPILVEVVEFGAIRWRGKLFTKWIFQGEHYLALDKLSEQQTKFIHGEKFSGLLSSVFKWIGALDKTKKGFKLFNGDLKRRSEANH